MADAMLDGRTLESAGPEDRERVVVAHLPRADEPVAGMEIYCNSFTTAHPEKLNAIAGVVSAYNRFLVGVHGRSPDALEPRDIQQLGGMLSALLGLEAEPQQPRPRIRR